MKRLLKITQHVFLFFCVIFLIIFSYEAKDKILLLVKQANIINIFFSLCAWQFLVFIIPWYSQHILKSQNTSLSYTFMLSTHINRLPAKYLPGGIWHTVARLNDFSKKGLSKKNLSILVLYENTWPNVIAAFISSIGLLIFVEESNWKVFALMFVILPLVIIPIMYLIRSWDIIFSFKNYTKLTLISCLYWFFSSLSFYLYVSSFQILFEETSKIVIGIYYIFSALIGFISIFTPQGIGVFEVAFTQLMGVSTSVAESIVVIAGFRFIIFFTDIINWVAYQVYIFLKRKFNKTSLKL